MSPSSRKDSKGRVLRTGECQRKDGTYEYRYKEPEANKRRSVYAPTLKELREKETQIAREIERGVRYHEGNITVSELLSVLGPDINRKWLQRNFSKYLGMPPKKYISLQRFIGAYDQFDNNSREDLLSVALKVYVT